MRAHTAAATFARAIALAASLAAACGGSGDGRTPAASTSAVATATGTAMPVASATMAAATETPAPGPSATSALPSPVPPTPAAPARVVYRGDPSRRVVALTFDAGADTGYAAQVLQTLRDNNIRATFGMTGVWAEANRGLLNAIAADGHQIINHSYDHRSFTGASTSSAPLSREERRLELSRTETTVYRITGGRSTRPYFRPPYGDLDASVQRDVAEDGYDTIVMWTVDSRGWDHLPAAEIVERCLSLAEPGAIYIMHVGAESQDAAALQQVVDGLRAQGYGFVTVGELLSP
jgi:peptidoglycan/xylan/chitin deacetylase (PgdA/CDA1 family)